MISDTTIYVVFFCVCVFFSLLAFVFQENKIPFKVTASMCWFSFALTQIYFLGGTALLAVPMMMFMFGFGFLFVFSIVNDFKQEKHQRIFGFED